MLPAAHRAFGDSRAARHVPRERRRVAQIVTCHGATRFLGDFLPLSGRKSPENQLQRIRD